MLHCARCGGSNDDGSRFCVSCGSPLARAPASAGPTLAPPPLEARGSAPPGAAPHVIHVAGPTGADLQFAATAAPPEGEELEARRAAVAAAVQAAQQLRAARAAAAAPAGATAAMPGVVQEPDQLPAGTPRILAGFLVSYEQQPLGRFWAVHQGRTLLGRAGAGAGAEIELDHPTTSTRHALLYAAATPGRIQVEDLGSTNGTLVNGVRLPSGTRAELRDGDRVGFGLFSAIVKII